MTNDWPVGIGTNDTLITSVHQTRDWDGMPDHIYIGMPGYARQITGYFGKPWELVKAKEGWQWAYAKWLENRIQSDPVYAGAVRALQGKTLVCFCKGRDGIREHYCHGDLLAWWAEYLKRFMDGMSYITILSELRQVRAE